MYTLKKDVEASLKESRNHLASKGRLGDGSGTTSVKTPVTAQEIKPHKEEVLIDLLSDDAPIPDHSNALV